MHFDEAYYYNRKYLKLQDFADNRWHKEDNKLFANSTDILDTSKPISQLNTTQKIYKTYPYSNRFCILLFLSNIPDFVKDEKHYNKDDVISEN